MQSHAHNNPVVNLKIAYKMASNCTKELYGKDRNLTNRDKYKLICRTGMPLYETIVIVRKMWLQCLCYTFCFDYSFNLRLIY